MFNCIHEKITQLLICTNNTLCNSDTHLGFSLSLCSFFGGGLRHTQIIKRGLIQR